jgi:hypothetical protein
MIFTQPSLTGIPVKTEKVIAASSDFSATSSSDPNYLSQVIPANSIGVDGFLILDIFMTRGGTVSLVFLTFTLGGEEFSSDIMFPFNGSYQTRIILYSNHSINELKSLANLTTTPTPYFKGNAGKVVTPVNLKSDNLLNLDVQMFDASDSFTVESYSVRAFNPSGINTIIGG